MSVNDPGLSLEERQAVFDWVRQVADMLFLRDVSIVVGKEPAEWAAVEFRGAYPEAKMLVNNTLLGEPDHEVVRSLVHEICHLPHGDWKNDLDTVMASVDDTLKPIIAAAVERVVERLVDHAARVIVAHVPLPPLTAVREATAARNGDDTVGALGGAVS